MSHEMTKHLKKYFADKKKRTKIVLKGARKSGIFSKELEVFGGCRNFMVYHDFDKCVIQTRDMTRKELFGYIGLLFKNYEMVDKVPE